LKRQYITSELIADGKLVIGDGYRAKNAELSATGFPFVRAGNLNNGFHLENVDCFPEENIAKVGEKISRAGDVVFTSKGTVGRFAYVDEDIPQFVYSPQLCYWRSLDWKTIYPRYLYYWINSNEFWSQAASVKGQTDMADYVSLTDQRRMTISLPSIEKQIAIAYILAALDDKIKLNQQINQTLEQTAQVLFKSWFVDFDPVVAKAAEKKPFGMSDEVASLFPDKFEDSEIGPIPEGYRVTTVAEVINLYDNKRIPLSATDRAKRQGIYPYYGAASIMDYIDDYLFDGIYLLLAEDGSVANADGTPVLQYVWGKFWVNNHAHILQGKGLITVEYLYLFFKDTYIMPCVTGAVQPKINQKNLRSIPFLLANEFVHREFNKKIARLFDLYRNNSEENLKLMGLRDILLPKLISSEIRIKNAEKIVSEAI
jgi:type I restriction enzyme, S subunit